MKHDHASLIASLKDMDMPLFESEAYAHSLQYYRTPRHLLNLKNRVKLLPIHNRYLVDDFPSKETGLYDVQLQNFLN